jgi:hypothetical protein
VDYLHAAIGVQAIAGNGGDVGVLMLGFDDENARYGIVLRVAVYWIKKAVTAIDVQRKSLPRRGDERNDMKILLAIGCSALALDIWVGRKPIRENYEVAGIFCENCCVPNVTPPLLSDLFMS